MTTVKEYRALLIAGMSEEELQLHVNIELTVNGWLWHHVRRSDRAQQQGGNGWPDIVAIRGSRVVVAELKTAKGRIEWAQQGWLDAWRATGAEVYVWKPDHLAEIARILR